MFLITSPAILDNFLSLESLLESWREFRFCRTRSKACYIKCKDNERLVRYVDDER